jgi:hypothetical protein
VSAWEIGDAALLARLRLLLNAYSEPLSFARSNSRAAVLAWEQLRAAHARSLGLAGFTDPAWEIAASIWIGRLASMSMPSAMRLDARCCHELAVSLEAAILALLLWDRQSFAAAIARLAAAAGLLVSELGLREHMVGRLLMDEPFDHPAIPADHHEIAPGATLLQYRADVLELEFEQVYAARCRGYLASHRDVPALAWLIEPSKRELDEVQRANAVARGCLEGVS